LKEKYFAVFFPFKR